MPLSKATWTVRRLQPNEVKHAAHFWAQEMGFDIGVRQLQRWYSIDPEAFLVAVDERGRVVGSGSAVRQTDSLYFVGTVGVREGYRGKGICRQILETLHKRNPAANYGLSSVANVLPLYQKLGYKVVADCYGYAYRGRLNHRPTEATISEGFAPPVGDLVQITPACAGHLEKELASYDEKVRGFRRDIRSTLLDDLTGLVLGVQHHGEMIGFGKVQENLRDHGAWIGPVYADDASTAKRLFDGLLQRFEAEGRISVYAVVADRGQFLTAPYSLTCVDALPRCYLRPEPEHLPRMELDKVFVYDCNDFCVV